MDKKEFNQRLLHPDKFSSQERGWLKAMASKYPSSAVVSVMTLLADHAFGFDTEVQRRAAALSMCQSAGLDEMLAAVQAVTPEPQSFDILGEINSYQEVSFKTAPKSVILSNFLKIATADGQEVGAEEPLPAEERDKKSLKADAAVGTETLAVILEKQGKFAKALEVYENLLARNPEKSSIFAPRIERLRAMINNK